MPELILKVMHHFGDRNLFSRTDVDIRARRHDTPPHVGGLANLAPAPRLAVADVIHFSTAAVFQRHETDGGQIFDVNQVHPARRGSDFSTTNPIQHVPSRSVHPRHS